MYLLRNIFLLLVVFFNFLSQSKAQTVQSYSRPTILNEPDWNESFTVPDGGRANPYNLDGEVFSENRNQGQIHAQIYPVTVTGSLPPFRPFQRVFENDESNLFRKWMNEIFKGLIKIKNFNDAMTWVGLHDYPSENDIGVYKVAFPNGQRPNYKMGFGIIKRGSAEGFTYSCAACHSANLFGKTVLGLTNRFPRANEFFWQGKIAMQLTEPHLFKFYTGATADEVELLKTLKRNVKSVTVKKPLILGLDTSLAQVALSLNRRNPDAIASRNEKFEKNPRPDLLDSFVADSKPAVWWNLKYKNRWLSDGSVISGNPIFTNLIWNEIGRGIDLDILEAWMRDNPKVIQELTTAVFSTDAPRITDFFSEAQIDIASAKEGEQIYRENCLKCHGNYVKKWDEAGSELLPIKEQIRTVAVYYKKDTPVIDVGTDPNRYLGMKSLEKLNNLRISRANGIVIKAQKGYVPPPLVGVWARWPYMHNNSIPNLCALLTRAKDRPRSFYQGAALDKKTDFDFECNGYPVGAKTPQSWKVSSMNYKTDREGMRNTGHDENIFLKDGKELLTTQQKKDLIVYLQTL